jgi:NAD(P)-dependent dehydrogenase (short-subunit alcohol dehydrogenase family)
MATVSGFRGPRDASEKMMKLSGKKAIVTGASQGLGLAIATAFVREGAEVLICARTESDLTAARQSILGQAPSNIRVVAELVDVSSEADVGRLAHVAEELLGGVDVLVCNAGILGPKGPLDSVGWSDWEYTIAINLNGTVLCCRMLLPLLRRSERGKILLLSGGGATKPMPGLSAYAASKAAVVRFGETLAAELAASGIDVSCIAPGALNTRLLDEVLAAGPQAVGRSYYDASVRQKQSGGASLGEAAALCVYLASPQGDGISGKLISAVWDPWRRLAEFRADLRDTDIYTLRRIMPDDRGRSWK